MSNRGILLLLVCVVPWVASGCGGGTDGHSVSSSHPASCRAGESALPLLPQPPGWWTEGKGPTLALACLHDRATGDAMLVGYSSPIPNGANCVAAYNLRLRWTVGEKCESEGFPWFHRCEGAQGCIWGFAQKGNMTGFMGMLSEKVRDIRILVRGKLLRHGVMVARTGGKTARSLGAEEPFVSYAAFVPECVEPKEVTVEFLGAAGTRFGTARQWNDAHAPCPGQN
jgi:hypothetical protein